VKKHKDPGNKNRNEWTELSKRTKPGRIPNGFEPRTTKTLPTKTFEMVGNRGLNVRMKIEEMRIAIGKRTVIIGRRIGEIQAGKSIGKGRMPKCEKE
jgi:hypothetical protein